MEEILSRIVDITMAQTLSRIVDITVAQTLSRIVDITMAQTLSRYYHKYNRHQIASHSYSERFSRI